MRAVEGILAYGWEYYLGVWASRRLPRRRLGVYQYIRIYSSSYSYASGISGVWGLGSLVWASGPQVRQYVAVKSRVHESTRAARWGDGAMGRWGGMGEYIEAWVFLFFPFFFFWPWAVGT